ncbi:hypothetical protein ACWCQ0_47155 [Streptomyces massasporeus]
MERLTSPRGGREAGERVTADGAGAPAAGQAALGHVSGLEKLLAALDEPLRTPPGSLLVRS